MTEQTLYTGLIYGWLILSAITFVALLVIVAPYGRHNRKGWGPQINDTLGWVLMEAPAPLLFAYLYVSSERTGSAVALVFLLLWLLHYVNRTFIFPFRKHSRGKRVPLAIVGMAIVFNLVNAYINGRYIFTLGPEHTTAWLTDPRFLAGAALFVVGYVINQHADHVLINLRQPRESGYKIPQGGLYRWVSSPNYLGEILEWTGWAIATWSIAGVAFAVWTTANLLPRALSNQRWYRDTFDNYPTERRAIIPYVL
jgi:protein-S-isoprenylcysteine O-methyltransferase Ste14